MKYRYFALAVVSIVSGWLPGLAQPADDRVAPEPSPPQPGVHETRPKGLARFLESLSPETRKRFEAAREKALQDPKLQELRQAAAEANKNFFRAMRDKMLEIDPGLADIVKGLAGERKGWKRWREERSPSSFGNLSEEELDKFISAREKAKSDPAVQTADKKRRDANTPEQRNAASEDYRNAMRQAMVKADPSIESLLEKIAAKPSPPPPNPANPEPSGEKGGPTPGEPIKTTALGSASSRRRARTRRDFQPEAGNSGSLRTGVTLRARTRSKMPGAISGSRS